MSKIKYVSWFAEKKLTDGLMVDMPDLIDDSYSLSLTAWVPLCFSHLSTIHTQT